MNKPKVPRLSVLIPTHEMNGFGPALLTRALESVFNQNLSSEGSHVYMEIVVSDNSSSSVVLDVCKQFSNKGQINVRYCQNPGDKSSASVNLNFGFRQTTGEIIKILFQDDFFVDQLAVREILSVFDSDPEVAWLVCGSTHSIDGVSFYRNIVPRYHDRIHLGNNTISSPSVVALRREAWEDFEPRLIWLMDVDFYKKMANKQGEPFVCSSILVANGIGPHQVSNTVVNRRLIWSETIYSYILHSKFLQKVRGHLFSTHRWLKSG